MITEKQIQGLGFELKNHNLFTGGKDYRNEDYKFLLSLIDGEVQIITAVNSRTQHPTFSNIEDLEVWLNKQKE